MARYDVETGVGYAPNHAVVPAPVNAPVIFLAPKQRTASSGELWIAASSPDANYGGCVVWLSNDTEHYYQIGVIDGRSHQGVLTAALPSAVGWDTVNTLSVDLAISLGILESVSQETADRLDSLCYVGGELIAFRHADPTGLHSYDLIQLHRGVYDTDAGAALNAPFLLLSGPMLRYRFNKLAVGGTLYFKFQGFNIYGGGVQDLADCVEYAFSVDSDGGVKALQSDLTPIVNSAHSIKSICDYIVDGDFPFSVGSITLSAGRYTLHAFLGTDNVSDTATVRLEDVTGAVLATVTSVSSLQWVSSAAPFEISATVDLDVVVVGSGAETISIVKGIRVTRG